MPLPQDVYISATKSVSRFPNTHSPGPSWMLTWSIQDLNLACRPGMCYCGRLYCFLPDIFLDSSLFHPQCDSPTPLRKPFVMAIHFWELVPFNGNIQEVRRLDVKHPRVEFVIKFQTATLRNQDASSLWRYRWCSPCLLTAELQGNSKHSFPFELLLM